MTFLKLKIGAIGGATDRTREALVFVTKKEKKIRSRTHNEAEVNVPVVKLFLAQLHRLSGF